MTPARRQISPHAVPLRRNQTEVERIFWNAVRDRRLDGFKFRRQATIGRYIVDFLCIEAKLIVELDGGQHSVHVDAERTAFLEQRGYQVVRFWNNEVGTNLNGVLQVTLAALARRRQEDPHPTLSRKDGRGLDRI